MRLKFLDIAKFHGSLAWGGQKSQIWAKFNSTQFFFIFAKFHGSHNRGCWKS